MSEVDVTAPDITPEMIAAGAEALKLSFSYDGYMDDYADVVIAVFLAMMQVAPHDLAAS